MGADLMPEDLAELRSRVARAPAAERVMSQAEHFRCPNCGSHVAADEDGCCAMCGADCVGEPCGGHVCGTALAAALARAEQAERERDELRAEVERLRAMFDTTRHRVLLAMGEHDKGRSWAAIEWTLAELRSRVAPTTPAALPLDPAEVLPLEAAKGGGR